MLKAAIFDMDGVIVNSEPLHRKAYYSMFQEAGIEVPEELYDSFTGKSTINICRQLRERFNTSQTAEEVVQIKRSFYNIIFENDKTFDLIKGVRSLIQNYYKNGLTLVLASSSSMLNIDRIFDRFNLNQYFKDKISGADLAASKPDPEIFLKAVESTGFSAEECMIIEDATNGIEAAKSAGIFCVGFNSTETKNQDYSKADLVIDNFESIHFQKISNIFQTVN
ncbi:MAG: HAD family phosphatase [Bacteroidota bacterium]